MDFYESEFPTQPGGFVQMISWVSQTE
jgi:hypothetical protein